MRGIRKTQDRGRALRTLVRTRRRLAAAALAAVLALQVLDLSGALE